jgi:hypothetical protein
MALHRRAACSMFVAALFVLTPIVPRQAQQTTSDSHKAVVTWSADLRGHRETPSSEAPSLGKATFHFDFDRQVATVSVETQDLHDVERIELRVARSSRDFRGPSMFTLYDTKDGKFLPTFTKTIEKPSFAEIAKIVLNGQGVITIITKSHPEGEAEGRIRMHKSYL